MGLSSSSLGCTGGTEDSSNHDGNDNGNAFHGNLFVKARGSNASKNNNLAKNKPNGGKLLPYAAAVDSDTIMANLSNHFTLSSRRSHKEFAYGTKHRLSSLQMGVNCRDFDQYHLIAQGGFGAVIRAQRKATGRWYALKVQPMETMARASRSRARKIEDETALHMERTVLATCRGHPFIVSLEYAFHTQRYAVLAMECVEGGTLSQLILASPAMMLPFDLAKTYTMEIALGINFMHSRGIIYRDLKPSNILIDRHGHVKLTDFGLSGSLVKRASNRRQALLDDISNNQDVYSDNDAQDPSRSLPLSPSLIQSAHMLRDIRESTRSTEHISESSEDPEISDQDETAYVAHVSRLAGRDGSDENDLRRVRRRTVCGTAGYRPPEQLQERYTHYSSRTGYDERADWFALGVCCYAMVTGKRAFPTTRELRRSERSISARNGSRSGSGEATPRVGNLSREASKKVMNDAEFRCLLFEVQYPVQFCAERDAESFVRALLELDPQSRLTYDGIMNHPWMKGEDFSNEGALQRPIPQWVKDHVYAQAKEVAKKENRWPQWKRLLRPRQYKSDRYNTLRECIDDMCKECYTTHDSSYAKTFGKKWTANARKSTIELFEHWAFLSEDAIAVEMNCASRGTRR
mmetsp:Transcript_22546/g.48949  ORF Transcript_22546/g.48949 Transcript_22546/m.48949 type:complete len:633 (-) Transcript_22546:66-1964(-)|eukprot:CAMPEP_0178526070 /NCGR_PEP_ID=MMETSP0696-20121128/30529_1 /TAXON_ID=265572 /ORGANISM="Extubocellulus spinifer, Strain CCMP396" /LENGTH=632 /DNA_ID=CAMNT_0020157545 /DNA_START=338 /DNA_END=2236 /DNA_ORIENTATION=-